MNFHELSFNYILLCIKEFIIKKCVLNCVLHFQTQVYFTMPKYFCLKLKKLAEIE